MDDIVIKDGVHFIGKECVKCGSRVRYVKGNRCVRCLLVKNARWNKNNPNYSAEYNVKNREKNTLRMRRWRQRNPERDAENSRKWRENNKDEFLEYRRNYYIENREWELERNKTWAKNNPEKVLAIRHRRRSRKANADGDFSDQEWLDLCDYYGNKCLARGCDDKLTADHVIPLIKGGTNYIWNIQPLCLSCNDKKARKIIDYRPIENIPQEYIEFLASLQ